MNLDFSAEPLFSWYVVLLIISGIAMVGIGAVNFGGLSAGWRVFNVLAGVGFVGYGVYLGFIFEGGEYIIFFKAFILPVLMIINFVRSLSARSKAAAPVQFVPAQQAPAPGQSVPAQQGTEPAAGPVAAAQPQQTN
ncbi:hypothetical protein KNE206_48740 [Kitasatospora sp. NE20-6]|uniref:hypothetical protein n=1 Tax=Kitasatospora sp. NE20-6 TaxID=2859066 RepID=UPI0034DBCEC9